MSQPMAVFLIEMKDASASPVRNGRQQVTPRCRWSLVKSTERGMWASPLLSRAVQRGRAWHPQPPRVPLRSLAKIFVSWALLLLKYWLRETGDALPL